MRFPKVFDRYFGTLPDGVKRLGSDAPPEGAPRSNVDNQLAMRLSNVNGFSVQRLCVGLVGPKHRDRKELKAFVYVHDDLTGEWFRSEPQPRTLHFGTFTYFDLPVLADNSCVGSENVGSLEVALVPFFADGDPPEGLYRFIVGADVSCPT